MSNEASIRGRLVWEGRPSVSIYYAIYGVFCLVVIIVLGLLEYTIGTMFGAYLFPRVTTISRFIIPYPVELFTAIIILLVFIVNAVKLAILRLSNKYELYEDGLYLDLGIVNLQNTYLSPMAFSDARLVRTLTLRLAGRGDIIVDANDGRHFQLKLIEKPQQVQTIIRRTLGHPIVRLEGSPSTNLTGDTPTK